MINFLFVRHGYSLANQEQIFAGITDVGLSDIGKKQADLVCDYILKNYKIDAVYSSELTRAKDTVKKIAETLDLPLITYPAFNEIYGGKWEGLTFNEIYEKYQNDLLTWRNDISNSRCTDGESFKELKNRTHSGLLRLASEFKNENKTIVIATHAGALRALICSILSLDDKQSAELGWVANASITTIVYDNGNLTIKELGYSDYLQAIKTELPKNI